MEVFFKPPEPTGISGNEHTTSKIHSKDCTIYGNKTESNVKNAHEKNFTDPGRVNVIVHGDPLFSSSARNPVN